MDIRKLPRQKAHRLIVETARRLYRQIGPEKTTTADIARELRTSPANIYRFFRGKAEIDLAVRAVGEGQPPPEDQEPVPPPDNGPPLAPLGAAAALPLPEQDRFLSLWPAKVA